MLSPEEASIHRPGTWSYHRQADTEAANDDRGPWIRGPCENAPELRSCDQKSDIWSAQSYDQKDRCDQWQCEQREMRARPPQSQECLTQENRADEESLEKQTGTGPARRKGRE